MECFSALCEATYINYKSTRASTPRTTSRGYRFVNQENARGIESGMQPQRIWGTSPCSMPNLEVLCWRTALAGHGRSPDLGRRIE